MKLTSLLRAIKANTKRSRIAARKQWRTARRRAAQVELLEDRRLLAATWERLEPVGSLMFQADISGQIGAPISVFADDFESGSLDSAWTTTSSTPQGRVEVSNTLGTSARSGSYHLAMQTMVAGPFNLNEAVFTADLSSLSEATLRFSHKDVDDEDHPLAASFTGSAFGDGVSISEDGTTWHRLVSLNNANSPNNVYTDFNFDLNAEAAAAGISLGPQFQVKFQQFDNFPFNTDGRTFDDVAITAPGPLAETSSVFLEADQTLTVVATPVNELATLSITVRDSHNAVLASSTASGPGETLAIQTIRIATDGEYTVEVTGDAASEYELSLFRNAAVEISDTEEGNELDATGSLIPVGPARFGIVGEFKPTDGVGGNPASGPIFTTHADGLRLGTIDTATGAGTDIGPFGQPQTWAAAFGTDGTLYTTTGGLTGNAVLASVNQTTGAVTTIGSGLGTPMIALEVAADGSMYGIGYGNRVLYEIDPSTGTATVIGDSGIAASMDLAFDTGGVLYATVGNRLWTVDRTTGASTLLGSITGIAEGSVMGIMFDHTDTLFATAPVADSPLYEIDLGSLTATAVGNTGFFRPHGGDILITGSGPSAVVANQVIAPEAMADIYGDPGEPGRFPNGPGAVAQPTAPNELLVNGSFETGDFAGWTTVTTSGPFRPWTVSGGGQGGGYGLLQTQPQDGTYVAWNGFDGNGPMEFQMYQDVTIAADSAATLSWMDRVQWNFQMGGFTSLPRLYDVEIRDPVTHSVLQTLFSFSTGTQAENPTGNTHWQTHSVDVSAFAGETVRVMFRERIPQGGTGPGQIEFDAISLTTDADVASGPDVDEYLLDLTGMAGQSIDVAMSSENGEPVFVDDNDLAIILSDGDPSPPVAELQATGFFDSITVINARYSTPTLTDLQEFESVLAYTSWVPQNQVALGNVLADYVDAGGHLVMTTYAYSNPWDIEGRITTSGYAPLTNIGVNGSVSGNIIATVSDDPIFDGIDVNAVTHFRNTNFAHPGIDAGATLLATDGAGHNMIARNAAGNVISLNIYPRSGMSANNQELFNLIGNTLLVTRPGGSGTLELLDTDGTTVLATGSPEAENFSVGIADFVVPADGVYTVRVSGDSGKYGIVVTNSLVFDTEPNTADTTALRSLDNTDGALGYLQAGLSGGDVDLSLINSFESLSLLDSGFIPPDPIVAAGPQSVVTMVNTDIAIHNKNTGAVVVKADLDGPGGFWNTSNVVFDPWIVFDPSSERFFAMGIDRSTFSGGSSRVYLAVSTDSTPSNLTTDWNKYTINRTGTHRIFGSSTFPDYPKLGVDDDAIYITGNDFGILSGGFSHVSLFAIEKAPLLTGGPANIVYDENITAAFSVHPVVNHDSGAPMQFAESTGSTGIRLHTLSNVLTTPTRTTTTVAVPTFYFPPDVPQQSGPPLDSVDQRIMSGVVRDGSLWTAHAIRDPAVDTETVVRWYEFDVSGLAPSLVQQGNVDPGPGVHTWMPHINVDRDGDMAIAFSVSGPTQFASIGYTGRLATDAPGTTHPVEIARTGQTSYSRFDNIGRNRWGDYSGLAIDPDGETFWLYNEYAATGNLWRTFVGAFQVQGSEVTLDSDAYTVPLAAGETIGLSTFTPFDDPTDSLNLLDPSIEILDPNGAPVAFDANGAGDGKNAAIPTFTAITPGTYKVIIGAETTAVGEYVLSVNWAPVIDSLAVSADTIFENESITLSGAYSDQNFDDSHTFIVDWDDPNDSDDSAFALPSINTIRVGDMFPSSTDGAVLEITAVDLLIGQVSFLVAAHRYRDDGVAPGNDTAVDRSTVSVTLTDEYGLVAGPPPQELLVNGDFETGDFTGWTISGTGSGNWVINNGSLDPAGPATPLPPISGDFDAVTIQGGSNTAILSELIHIPSNVSGAMLSWSDRIRNAFSSFNDPLQEWRVLLLDSNGGLIQELFSTDPGDPTQQVGPNHRSFDLAPLFQSLAGQTVQLSFEQQSAFSYFNVTLDDVRLTIKAMPSVLVQNAQPELELDAAGTFSENTTFRLSGSLSDQGLLDEHQVTVNWDDQNAADNSTFALPAISAISVGDTFQSSTDSGVMEITALDLSTGKMRFDVTHVYADDGPAPGNSTPSDASTITVTVSDDDPVRYDDFSNTTGLALNGDANTTSTTDAPVLRLASATTFDVGSAFSLLPIDTADGFSTQFAFRISDPAGAHDGTEPGSDGFTFTLQNQGPAALGGAGGGLGYQGITPSIAVEFDTWRNGWESSSNHLGININGNMASLAVVDEPTNKWDNGTVYHVWIDYDGTNLQVRLNTSDSRPATANLGLAIDIPNHLGQDLALAGFTAATGGAFGNHDILSWQMDDLAVAKVNVLVSNATPEIHSLDISATKGNKANPGDDVTLAATFSDSGLLDRHVVTIDWDDDSQNSVFDLDATADLAVGDSFTSLSGDAAVLTIADVVPATGEVRIAVASHHFVTGGIFDVGLTVSDDDTGTAAEGTRAWVTGLRVDGNVLQIIGSSVDDHVSINLQGNGLLKVHADYLPGGNFETFVAADVEKMIAYLGEGDDTFTIAGNVPIPAIVHGDGGNDHLHGGRGSNVLLGGDGDDMLIGGFGSDVLIGGMGVDRLTAGSGADVLIGGSTSDDEDDEALMDLLLAWAANDSYDDRVAAIDALLTVNDDEDEDRMTGGAGEDLFYDGTGDQLVDVKTTGNASLETVL